jgi:hypothetical protein
MKNFKQNLALSITTIIMFLLTLIAYFIKQISKLVWKLRTPLYKLAIIILVSNSILSNLQLVVYAPKLTYATYEKPANQREEIINYIIQTFGKYSDDAIAIANCESHLNPRAFNNNESWGGVSQDLGVFQINKKYQGVTNSEFLYDYKINTNIAWNIFQNRGYNWGAWTCSRTLGI